MGILEDGFKQLNILYDESTINNFLKYKELLLEWNNKINLTTITDDEDIDVKHFLDSISPLNVIDFKDKSVIDVGTGAGFPGLPIKIVEKSIKLTLLDSLNKRINFLDEVISSINADNAVTVHGRAEDAARDKEYRENYDIAVSRAVANLPVLLEYCMPFVKVNGYFVCLKGPNVNEEINEATKALNVLGGVVERIEKVELPHSDIVHSVIIIKKIRQTPTVYPRKAGTPSKKPIK